MRIENNNKNQKSNKQRMNLRLEKCSNRKTWNRINRKNARRKDEKIVRVIEEIKQVLRYWEEINIR